MLMLLAASLVWAFSFGLIKHRLVGVGADPMVVAAIRLALSLLVFLPFWRPRRVSRAGAARLMGVGAVQYGLMYVAYLWAFRSLAAHEVALFTVLTPIYVVLVDAVRGRRWRTRYFGCALLAVAGAAVVLVGGGGDLAARVHGVLLLQVANLAFAFGQVVYAPVLAGAVRRAQDGPLRDRDVFAWLYAGGWLVAVLAALPAVSRQGWPVFAPDQVWTLLYLGLVPSGLGFFLWNAGARRTTTGVLAAMNNAKVPLGVLVALLVFEESAPLGRLLAGAALLAGAVVWARRAGR